MPRAKSGVCKHVRPTNPDSDTYGLVLLSVQSATRLWSFSQWERSLPWLLSSTCSECDSHVVPRCRLTWRHVSRERKRIEQSLRTGQYCERRRRRHTILLSIRLYETTFRRTYNRSDCVSGARLLWYRPRNDRVLR